MHKVLEKHYGPPPTLGKMLHAKKDFLEEMPTELSLEGFVEKIILEMKMIILGRRNSISKGTVRTDKRLINSLLLLLLLLSCFSRVRLCATPQMAAHQAPPSLGFSRQEHWSGLRFPSPSLLLMSLYNGKQDKT